MKLNNYFSTEVIDFIKDTIDSVNGSKIYFKGLVDKSGIISSVTVFAPGDSDLNISKAQEGAVIICNHEKTPLTLSKREDLVKKVVKDNLYGFYLIDNDLTSIKVIVEPYKQKDYIKLDIEESGKYISKGGALDLMSDSFEERPSQVKLLKSIAKAFNEDKIAAFEAGTGVGKSYSYLIPAILWVSQNSDEKIVISTGTINLQHQLCDKDIPAVEKILGRKVKYMLVKGRQNYICKRRLLEAGANGELLLPEEKEYESIKKWAEATKTGSKSEIPFMPNDVLWAKINSDSDSCMGKDCPFYDSCFVQKMKADANKSSLLIVNHHLLFADIETRLESNNFEITTVLPGYNRIIFDEAHGIESAATSFFSDSFTVLKLKRLLNKVYRKKNKTEIGFLPLIAAVSDNGAAVTKIAKCKDDIEKILDDIETIALDVLDGSSNERICNANEKNFGPVFVIFSQLSFKLSNFVSICSRVLDGVGDEYRGESIYWELKSVIKHILGCINFMSEFIEWKKSDKIIFWMQKKWYKKKNSKEPGLEYIVFNKTPLDIATVMKEGVFDNMKSVISTSATLKTGNDFSYWMNRVGLNLVKKDRVITDSFESPFPYDKNMLFSVPSDAPSPDNSQYQQYLEMAVPRLIMASEGSTLVLFTSYDSLFRTYKVTVNELKNRGFKGKILKQGDGDSGKLLEEFKNDENSVLFATDSFWQGVDVPGDALKQVIIVKLPFTVPNDPIFIARAEAITKKGGNSFMDLSVPDAIIKFRQGIGRLIRRSDDRGSVVILDNRIIKKRYGSIFINSIPKCIMNVDSLRNILNSIKSFIFE